MRNVIDAIIDIVERNAYQLNSTFTFIKGKVNSANSQGIPFEQYIINLFSDNLFEIDQSKYYAKINDTFGYIGVGSNYPPDLLIFKGDAIEVKSSDKNGAIQLNSSYPKDKLYKDSPKLLSGCFCKERWEEKDMLYILGTLPNNKRISQLMFVYGSEFCAHRQVYEQLVEPIKEAIDNVEYEKVDTKELGSFPSVDLLGYTNLRVRGMWTIQHPLKIFKNIYNPDKNNSFNLMVLVDDKKFNTFENRTKLYELTKEHNNLEIQPVKIPDPNTQLAKSSILITYFVR